MWVNSIAWTASIIVCGPKDYKLGLLQKVLLDMPGGEEFCTHDPHLEGAEMFGSQKRRPDTPIGDDGETHRPDTVNFSWPRPGKRVTRSQPETLPTIIEEFSPSVQEV
jgi:hypothetical protein